MRKILIGVGVLVAAVVVGLVLLMSNLDGIVKTAIETVGTKVAGVKVSVDKVEISIKEGKGSIAGLTVANPAGFKTPNAFSLGLVSVTLDTASVTGNPIVIKDVTIAKPEVTYEMTGSGSNIDAIQKNVAAFTAANAPKGGAAQPAAAPAKDSGDAKKVVIDQLSATGGSVTLATPIPGGKATASLPDIHLSNIGKSEGGASPAEVATKLLDSLTGAAMKAASSMGVGAVLDSVKGAVGNVGGAASGAAAGGVNAVKGLFGK